MQENSGKRRKKLPKNLRRWIILAGTVAFLLGVFTILAELYIDDFVKHQIQKSVYQASDRQYFLRINELDADFWTGDVSMEGVSLIQDTSVLKQLRLKDPGENFPEIRLQAEGARIDRLRWLNFLLTEDLRVKRVEIISPSLIVEGVEFTESLRSTNENFIELLPGIIAGFAVSLKIGELIVRDGDILYEVETEKGTLTQRADELFIDLTEVRIDTISRAHLLYSDNIEFSLKDYRLADSDSSRLIAINDFSASVKDSTFRIDRIHYRQKSEAGKELAADVFIKEISGSGVNFRSFAYGKQIIMDSMLIRSPDIRLMTESDNREQDEKQPGPNILMPEFLSEFLQSFSINVFSIQNGKMDNEIIGPERSLSQSADNIFITITQVAGNTVDTFKLSSPGKISVSLQNYLVHTTAPEMKLNLRSIDASTETGILSIDGIDLSIDHDGFRLKTLTDGVRGNGFRFRTALDQQKVVFDSLVIRSPDVEMHNFSARNERKSPESTKGILPRGLPEPVSAFIKAFEINLVSVENGTFEYRTRSNGNPVRHRAGKVDLTINKLFTDSPDSPVDFASLDLGMQDYLLKIGEQRFTLKIASTQVSSANSAARLKNIYLEEDHPPGKEENHFYADCRGSNIYGLDVKRFLKNVELYAEKADINHVKGTFLVHVGKGARPEFALKMPNEIISKLGFYMNLREVTLNNVFIKHEDPTGSISTIVTFEDSRARIRNLTNDPRLMSPESPAEMEFTTYVMGRGRLDAVIKVPLLQQELNGSYHGSFTGMEATVFNEVLRGADLFLESGHIDSAYFDMDIKNGTAAGTVTLLYHNLELDVLDSEGEKSRIRSLLGEIITRESNPDEEGEKPEAAEVEVSRKPTDSFFSFLWHPILEGITKTVTKDRLTPDAFVEQ